MIRPHTVRTGTASVRGVRGSFAPQPGTRKQREIRFNRLPPNQAEQAARLLAGLENLQVALLPGRTAVSVCYEITEYTLQGLEQALSSQGFHLDNGLYSKILRALVRFCEQTQLHNLGQPERLIRKSNEVYVKAYEHHPHGDHDDTPPELREYK